MDPRWQTVEIGQMFPWPGRLAAANQEALAEAAAIRQMYEAARQEVRYQVAYRYFEYGYLQEALRSISQNIELMASWTEIIRSRYVTSQTTQPDLLKTEVELALLRNDSLQLTNTLKNSQVQLNEALNRPLDARLPAIREETTQKLTIGQATLEQLVRAGNPEVLAGREKIIAAEARTAAMRREAYPDIMLAASYGWPAGNAGAMDRSTMVMGSVFLPLWWGKKKAGSTEAEALRQAQEKETQETANRMAARAFQMYYEYQNAEQQTMLYESDLLPKAEQSLKIIAAQYLTGATDILMLVDMERTVFDLKLKKAGAFKAAQQARAELEMLAGQELP
jgi:outer membrane protein TolC